VERLLKAGANPCQVNENGSTPLHFAAGTGHPEVVQVLLNYKADPKLQDKERKKAIDLAREYKENRWEEVVALLTNA
jgi:Krev interaction trapped protein 1